jgi:hypothetical protein
MSTYSIDEQTMLTGSEMIAMRDNASDTLRAGAIEAYLKKQKKAAIDFISEISEFPTALPRCLRPHWRKLAPPRTKRFQADWDVEKETVAEFDIDLPEHGLGNQ